MASHGGARPGAGKPKGSRNRATVAQKATFAELAKALAPEALQTLADVMRNSESDNARVAASNSIIERAYGKVQVQEPDDQDAKAQSLNVTVNAAAPIGEIRVTRSDG